MNQDWTPVILNKKKTKVVNDPLFGGEVIKKDKSNKVKQPDNLSKVAKAESAEPIKYVDIKLSQRIQQARVAKGLTQEQLAHKINEQKCVVVSYESGKAIPNNNVMIKLEKVLGSLR